MPESWKRVVKVNCTWREDGGVVIVKAEIMLI